MNLDKQSNQFRILTLILKAMIDKHNLEQYFIKGGIIKENERIAVGLAFGYPKSSTSYAHRSTGDRIRDSYDKKFTTL